MYSGTPIHLLLCKAGFIPAPIVFDYRQRVYAHQLLSFPELHPAKQILRVSLRKRNRDVQSEKLTGNTLWTQNSRPTLFGQ